MVIKHVWKLTGMRNMLNEERISYNTITIIKQLILEVI